MEYVRFFFLAFVTQVHPVEARIGNRAVVVARFFPRFEREQELLAAYRAEDRRPADPGTRAAGTASPTPA